MVGAVEPADEVWSKIRTAVTAIKPEARDAAAGGDLGAGRSGAAGGAGDHAGSKQRRVAVGSRPPLAQLAGLTTALAASLAAFVVVQAYRPDLLPEQLRPQPRVETVTAPQPAQFVAVLQRDGGSPAFIMTLDTTTKEFTVRKAGADAPAGRAYELWMVSDRFNAPRSLGIIGATDFTT